MVARSVMEVLKERRLIWVGVFGFSSGLPYMLTGRTLKLWAASAGVELAEIGLLSLVTLPVSLKFLWAPLMDQYEVPVRGRRMGWMSVWQAGLVVSLGMMAGLGWRGEGTPSSQWLMTGFVVAALATAIFSASLDVVEAAYRTDLMGEGERAAGATAAVMGYRAAMLVSGAGAVALAGSVGWNMVYGLCALMMLYCLLGGLGAQEPAAVKRERTLEEAVVKPFKEFWRRYGSRAVVVLVFIFLFKLPDYMANALTDAMLLKLGYSNGQISVWSLGLGTAVTIPGVAAGGLIAARMGIRKGLVVMGLTQAASNMGYMALVWIGKPVLEAMVAAVAIEYFCAGLVAAGFVTFLMSLCDRRYSATQYALLSGLMALSASVGGAPSGVLAEWLGYTGFLAVTVAIGIPGVMLIAMLPRGERRGSV